MKIGGSSSGKQQWMCQKPRRAMKEICYENSVMKLIRYGRSTLRFVSRETKRQSNIIPENTIVVFDNICPDYDWIRSGRITEERVKHYNKLYRYSYDPWGQIYYTRYTVACMCADLEKDHELIVLDK